MTRTYYCRCGASFKATVPDTHAEKLEAVLALWRSFHTGDGHRETNSKGASNARYFGALTHDPAIRPARRG